MGTGIAVQAGRSPFVFQMGFLDTEAVPRKGTSLRKGMEGGGSEVIALGSTKLICAW